MSAEFRKHLTLPCHLAKIVADAITPSQPRLILSSGAGLHHMSAGALSPVPSADGKLAQAVSAVVGDPQAVYLFNLRRYQTRALKGVTQNLSGQFIAKARLGGDKVKRLGVYATLHEAARAYDAAVFEHAGKNAKLNYPEEYVSRLAQV